MHTLATVANTSIGSVAGTITALASVLTALGLLITALTVFIPILRKTKDNTKAINEVHTIVNQQQTDLRNYNEALRIALAEAGVKIPNDQSLGNPAHQPPPTP